MTQSLRLGTRRSALALAQSGLVARAVTAATGRPVELVEITTFGDVSRAAMAQIGGTGVFVSALRDALLADEIDFAVHSLKDLPAGARVGTGAPRRAAQLRLLRADLEIVPVRGNVDTRIGYVTAGRMDAVVLAYAGLSRLDRIGEATDFFEPAALLPAPGQGALAVECRAQDRELTGLLGTTLDHGPTRQAVAAERALLAALEAGCSAPVGGYAVAYERELVLHAAVTEEAAAANDGVAAPRSIRMSATGPADEAAEIGRELALRMLAVGAAGLMGKQS